MKRAVDECHSWESDLKNVGRKASQTNFQKELETGCCIFLWSIFIFFTLTEKSKFQS